MTPVSAPNNMPQPAVAATSPGKSAGSVGHLARQAVAAARDAGVELPKNAQGLAARQIARGADAASVFAAQIAALAPAESVGEAAAATAAGPTMSDAIAAYEFNSPAITTTALAPAPSAPESPTSP